MKRLLTTLLAAALAIAEPAAAQQVGSGLNVTLGSGLTATSGSTSSSTLDAFHPNLYLINGATLITSGTNHNVAAGELLDVFNNTSNTMTATLPALNTTGFQNGATYCQINYATNVVTVQSSSPFNGVVAIGQNGWACETVDVPNNVYDVTLYPGGGLAGATSMGSTLSVTSGVLNVATGGITATQIASATITSTQMASGAAATNVGTLGGDLSGTLPNPTVAKVQGDANVALLDVNQSFTKGQAVTPISSSVTGAITPDFSTTNAFVYTITGALTINNPTNVKAGQCVQFWLTENATGGFSVSWGGSFHWAGGAAPVLTTTANAANLVSVCAQTTSYIAGALVGANIQ